MLYSYIYDEDDFSLFDKIDSGLRSKWSLEKLDRLMAEQDWLRLAKRL